MFFQTDNFRSLGIYRCWLIPWTFFPFFFLLRSLGRQPTDTQTHTKRVASLSPPPPPTARHPKGYFVSRLLPTLEWSFFILHIYLFMFIFGPGEERLGKRAPDNLHKSRKDEAIGLVESLQQRTTYIFFLFLFPFFFSFGGYQFPPVESRFIRACI
jgi:hypothetical protein